MIFERFMHHAISLALLAGTAALAPAQAPAASDDATTLTVLGDAPLVTTGTMRLLRTIETFHKDVKTIHATFDQVRVDEVFLDETKSAGELWFRKPDEFRCDYADPQPMITLILKEALYIYVPELDQVEYWRFESEAARRQQLHQLLIGFGFNADDLVQYYEIFSSEDSAGPLDTLKKEGGDPDKTVLFLFRPRPSHEQNASFVSLKLYIDKASLLPQKIWYRDLNEASMTLTMRKVETDVPIAEAVFDRQKLFPRDVEYLDKRNTP